MVRPGDRVRILGGPKMPDSLGKGRVKTVARVYEQGVATTDNTLYMNEEFEKVTEDDQP